MLLILCGAAFVAAAVLFWYHGPHSRFRRCGVKHPTPLPLLGDMGRTVFRMLHYQENMNRIYKRFPEERFFGMCEFTTPIIVVRDPELVKRISIADFEHFQDHGIVIDKDIDEISGRGIFSLKGQEWKDTRSKLNPLFSISKLRAMTPFMKEAADKMLIRLKREIKESGQDFYDLDMRDVCSRHATDVYAVSIYGLKVDSQNSPNKFYEMCKSLAQLGFQETLKFLGFLTLPGLMKILNISLMNSETIDFFKKLIQEMMSNREAHAIDRPGMVNLILQIRKEKSRQADYIHSEGLGDKTKEPVAVEKKITKQVFSETEFLAQAIGFLVAGVEEVTVSMAFLVHMLALHPEIQDKLVMEIRDHSADGNVNYDTILNMTYLDMVVSETLRLWSATFVMRVCTKDYNLGRPNDTATEDYIVRKGDNIRFYSSSIHLDPEYFDDPRTFDPERFSKENRHKIRPGAYNPFGLGPRQCIGYKFAITEIKIMICTLLQHVEISACPKTNRNIRFSTSYMIPVAIGGNWVRIRLRK